MTLTPSEMVRIELLRHEDPSSIHPVEKSWRELSRKLLLYSEFLQTVIIAHHDYSQFRYVKLGDDCPACKKVDYIPIKFPESFK